MWQLAEAVRGIGDACRALDIPITGGNVSLYNETAGRAVYPTPVLGVLGLLEDATRTATRLFKREGAIVLLLGDNLGELGGSEYLATMHGAVAGHPPAIDLARERALQRLVVGAVQDGLLESAHDCADGGLAIALAECCFDTGGLGVAANVASVPTLERGIVALGTLFGESASRVVVSLHESQAQDLMRRASAAGVPTQVIGRVGGERIRLSVDGVQCVDVSVRSAEHAWATAIETMMVRQPADV
jgi:phosphoribosylformylglycinamidine synthase